MSLADIMVKDPVTADENDLVIDVVAKMANKNIGVVLVTQKSKIIGLFSERDLLRRVVPEQVNVSTTPIKKYMTTELKSIPEDAKASVAMDMMLRNNIRHLPVINANKTIIGLVSIRDIMRVMIKGLVQMNQQMKEELDQLRFLNL